ncbi:unnamed protein product [Linum trigynum]|uniref:CCHC-type domain-containing protein n=1 Tax=Linum trigynum TaxID=586398 RepID=A0AAV2E894_9ROSI
MEAKELASTGTEEGVEEDPAPKTLSLEEQLDKITLAEDDEPPLEVEDSDVDVVRMEAVRRLGLVGRLMAEKQPNLKSLKIALEKAWNLRKGFQITDLKDKLFAFQFLEEDDKNKVIFGGPWHYENNVIVFKECLQIQRPNPSDLHLIDLWAQIRGFLAELRTAQMASKIATRFGELVWFDDTGYLWDEHMRIRVSLSINNPLRKKIKLNIKGRLEEYQVKYEKLPMFCYSCGRIGHPKLRCDKPSRIVPDPFGMELRTDGPGPRSWPSHAARREDAEVWEKLRKKFEAESSGSNSDHDRSFPEEREVIRQGTQERKEDGNKDNQNGDKEEEQMEVDKQSEVQQSTGEKRQEPERIEPFLNL